MCLDSSEVNSRMSLLNPLAAVRASCSRVVEVASHVVIREDAIHETAVQLQNDNFLDKIDGVQWDSSGWHYCLDAKVSGPLTAQYVFVLDTLNFCFWPCEGLEYDTLATRLKNVLERDSNAFSASNLINVDSTMLASWFEGFEMPQLDERVSRLNELGESLQKCNFGIYFTS